MGLKDCSSGSLHRPNGPNGLLCCYKIMETKMLELTEGLVSMLYYYDPSGHAFCTWNF